MEVEGDETEEVGTKPRSGTRYQKEAGAPPANLERLQAVTAVRQQYTINCFTSSISHIALHSYAIRMDDATPSCPQIRTTGSYPIGTEHASTNLQPLQ